MIPGLAWEPMAFTCGCSAQDYRQGGPWEPNPRDSQRPLSLEASSSH